VGQDLGEAADVVLVAALIAVRAVLRRAAPHLEERGLQAHRERIARPLRHPEDIPEVIKVVVIVVRGDRRRQGAGQGGGDRRRTANARQELTPTVTRGRGLCGHTTPPLSCELTKRKVPTR
jgi:hypothetical protein